MKVSANLPSGAKPANRALPNTPTQPKGRDGGFADALRGANGYRDTGLRLPNLAIGVGNSRFEVATKIGDDAVRFDARPIVAPTGEAELADDANMETRRSPSVGIAMTTAPTHAELGQMVEHLVRHLPVIAEHLTLGSGPVAAVGPSAARNGRVLPFAGTPTVVAPASGGRGSLAPTAKSAEDIAAKPSVAPPPAQTSTLAARVSALPREIIIVVRGVALSTEERETLADTVRRELAPLRLGDRTIRIIGAGGRF